MSVRTFASRRLALVAAALALVALAVLAPATATATTTIRATPSAEQPDFGPNVFVFNPGMPQSQIQATVDAVAAEQVGNQFGTQRFALLFEPGTYGSAASPLIFQVGYYTTVAGLGASPTDVTVNGAIDVFNQCDSGGCTALVNFWRSLSNLTINVTLPATPPTYVTIGASQNAGRAAKPPSHAPAAACTVLRNGFDGPATSIAPEIVRPSSLMSQTPATVNATSSTTAAMVAARRARAAIGSPTLRAT